MGCLRHLELGDRVVDAGAIIVDVHMRETAPTLVSVVTGITHPPTADFFTKNFATRRSVTDPTLQ